MKQRIRLTESDLHRIVKESVKRVLRETSEDFYVRVKDSEDTPFSPKTKRGTNIPKQINGAFSDPSSMYNNTSPYKVAELMMNNGEDFGEFIEWCEERGLNPYDYIDQNDMDVTFWIEDYV